MGIWGARADGRGTGGTRGREEGPAIAFAFPVKWLKKGYQSATVTLRVKTPTSALATGGLEDGGGLSKLLTRVRIEGTIVIMSSDGGNHMVLDMVKYSSTW